MIGLWSVNNTIRWLQPVRNSYSVRANIIDEHSLISVKSRIPIDVNNLELAEINFIFFSVGCCFNNAAPMPVFEAFVQLNSVSLCKRLYIVCKNGCMP